MMACMRIVSLENINKERTTNVALIAGPFCGSVAGVICLIVVVVFVMWKRGSTDNTRRDSTPLNSDTIQSQGSGRPTTGTDMDRRQGDTYSVDPHVDEELRDTNENTLEYESVSTGDKTTTSSEITYGNLQILAGSEIAYGNLHI